MHKRTMHTRFHPAVRNRGGISGKLQAVLIVIALGAVAYHKFEPVLNFEAPVPAAARDGKAIHRSEFQALLDGGGMLSSLALPGQYTVVEVYLDTCAICRKLESGFDAFTKRRSDVIIQRVHFPERGIQFSVNATTQAEADRQVREFSDRVNAFQVCGTPHVEIYGPGGEAVARDACGDKSGTRYLRRWMASETGLALDALQPAGGANAVTAIPAGG